ncbi:MAG TPA: FHA domain-containing protein [Isosphaeraceae bacterium]|jgi:anti-anti-sigma factor
MNVELIAQVGGHSGQAIPVEVPEFVIGRDTHCHLRPHSLLVSRRHAVIQRRGEHVFVRDLETRNGTLHNGHLLRSAEAELGDGDQIQVGPLTFTVRITVGAVDGNGEANGHGPRNGHGQGRPKVEEIVAHWLLADAGDPRAPTPFDLGPGHSTEETALAVATLPVRAEHLKFEAIQDVLVVRILPPDLDDERTVSPVRSELTTLLERLQPRRVVVSLEEVTHLSGRATVMLLAHAQHLGRDGGSMRLGHVRPRVMASLREANAPMLVRIYPTVDEAVLDVWK